MNEITIVNNDIISEICCNGNDNLGDNDWDGKLVKYLKDQFVETISYSDEFEPKDTQYLLLRVEELNIQLSINEVVTCHLFIKSDRANITITRDRFDLMTKSILDGTFDVVERDFATAEKKYSKI